MATVTTSMTTTVIHEVIIRPAQPADILGLLRIERASGMEDVYNDKDFQVILQHEAYGMIVADLNDKKIVGYCAYQIEKTHFVLMSLAVAAAHQRKGIGRELLASVDHRKNLCKVRETNLQAQLFLKGCGFRWFKTYPSTESDESYTCPPEAAYAFRRDKLIASTTP